MDEYVVCIKEEIEEKTWWELHGKEVAAGVLMLGLGIGIPAFFLRKKVK